MILSESCGCGAAITIEDGPDDVLTGGIRRSLIDEFRTLHRQCRSDERAELAARATPATVVNSFGTPAGWPNPDGEGDEPELDRLVRERREKLGEVLDWDPYGPGDNTPDTWRLDLVADWVERVNSVRGIENRVPGDLRRIAADLRDLRDRGPGQDAGV